MNKFSATWLKWLPRGSAMSKKHVKTPSPKKQVEDPFSPDVTRAIQRVVEEIEVAPEPTRLESPFWRFGAGLLALLTPGCVGIFAKLGPDLLRLGNHCWAHDTHTRNAQEEWREDYVKLKEGMLVDLEISLAIPYLLAGSLLAIVLISFFPRRVKQGALVLGALSLGCAGCAVLLAARVTSCLVAAQRVGLQTLEANVPAFLVHLQEPRLRLRIGSGPPVPVPPVETVVVRATCALIPILCKRVWTHLQVREAMQAASVRVVEAQQWGLHAVRSRQEELEEDGVQLRAIESRAARETVIQLAKAGLLEQHFAWFHARSLPPVMPQDKDGVVQEVRRRTI